MPNQVGSRNVATRNREVAILVVNASTNVFVKRRTYDGYVESVLNQIRTSHAKAEIYVIAMNEPWFHNRVQMVSRMPGGHTNFPRMIV